MDARKQRSEFPSPRATRLGLLVLVPGALLVGSMGSSWAQSFTRWAEGDVLTADALNTSFEALHRRIDELEGVALAPLSSGPADARFDNLRWTLLHAAAVGACGGSPSSTSSPAFAETIPRPPGRDCTDVCGEAAVAGGRVLPDNGLSACIAAVSVGGIVEGRGVANVSVGHGFRYPCDGEAPPEASEPFDSLAFAETDAPPNVRDERLVRGHAQYCCCGNAFTPYQPETPESPRGDGDS